MEEFLKKKNTEHPKNLRFAFDKNEEYQKMVSLLKFVFPHLPKTRKISRGYAFLTDEEIQEYEQIAASKLDKIICIMDEDFIRCQRLLCYLLLVKLSTPNLKINHIEKDIKNLFHSFSKDIPYYYRIFENEEQSSDERNCKKRNPNVNKREALNCLYERVFIKRLDAEFDYEKKLDSVPYINEEKNIVDFLLHIDPAQNDIMILTKQRIFDRVIGSDQSSKDNVEKLEKTNAQVNRIVTETLGTELLKAYEHVECNYEGVKNYIYHYHSINRLGKEDLFDELNSAEIELIDFLYELYYKKCEKHGDENKAYEHNINNPKNSRKWEILEERDRETLAKYIWNLRDGGRTILKYIGDTELYEYKEYTSFYQHSANVLSPKENWNDEEENSSKKSSSQGVDKLNDILKDAEEVLLLLVASVSNHPYYGTFKRVERIFQFCKDAPYLIDLKDPDVRNLYLDLEFKIKQADAIYMKLAKCMKAKQKVWEQKWNIK